MSKSVMVGIVLVLMAAGLLPFALIALARSRPSTSPPVHPVQDMYHQPKFKSQRENPMFADGRAMRPLIPGVIAREDMMVSNEVVNDPDHPHMIDDRLEPFVPKDAAEYVRLTAGTETDDGKPTFVTKIPLPVTEDFMRRGRERFNIYCAACHGLSGYGDGTVARRAAEMQAAGADTASGWVAPANYHTDEIRKRAVGHLYNTITNGIRTMPAYAKQISIEDRWAIVAYVKALERSQNARPADVPENQESNYQK